MPLNGKAVLPEIAALAGVSPAVALRVLHGGRYSLRIPGDQADRIHQVAARLGYQPDAATIETHAGRAHSILFSMPVYYKVSGDSQYFANLLDGAMTAAFDRGCTLALAPIGSHANPLSALDTGRYDGIVWSMLESRDDVVEAARERAIPLVLLHAEKTCACTNTLSMGCDNVQGMELAVEHLAMLGHRNIAFVTYRNLDQPEFALRENAMAAAVRSKGLRPWPTIAYEADAVPGRWRGLAREGLTAIVCASEALAGAILREAAKEALWLPDELSVVGFDSTSYCETTMPKLTAVHQPLFNLGYDAVATLVERAMGFDSGSDHRLFPCTLDVRDSTAPPLSL
ncbi:MAG TPA: LacI family DNA-binding transcriptional regulator [Fimbriimonas sp.]